MGRTYSISSIRYVKYGRIVILKETTFVDSNNNKNHFFLFQWRKKYCVLISNMAMLMLTKHECPEDSTP